ncbi:hypothetical protein J6590_011366 [Homalodisca vitripennis]|nr:hypothetical protein J6590_011366 [Homalodisca vitripennis]
MMACESNDVKLFAPSHAAGRGRCIFNQLGSGALGGKISLGSFNQLFTISSLRSHQRNVCPAAHQATPAFSRYFFDTPSATSIWIMAGGPFYSNSNK